MKKKIILNLVGEKNIKRNLYLPLESIELRKELSNIREELGEYLINNIESIDINYMNLEIKKDTSIVEINNILKMNKRDYSLFIVCGFDKNKLEEIKQNKKYIFIPEVSNENEVGRKLKEYGFIGADVKNHINLGYTKDGIIYDYINIFNDFYNKGLWLLKNDCAVMQLSDSDYSMYKHLLLDNSKEIISVSDNYSAQEIAYDNYLISCVEEYGSIRKCSCCGQYVSYMEMAGEKDIKDDTYYDICDECSSLIELGIIPEYIEEFDYEDYCEENI